MQDRTIQHHISDLVEEEHKLRGALQAGRIESAEEQSRLRQIEEELDQYWDLLRRRRSARDNHGDPDVLEARSIDTVEHYQQ